LGALLSTAIPIPLGEGMAGRGAATRQSLLIADLNQIELKSPTLRQRGINSRVAIPLLLADQGSGVFHARPPAFAQFAEEDVRLLELIADRIALAINQASLHDAERIANERLSFLGEASTLLAASLDVDEILEQLAALLVTRYADWAAIHLVQ